MYELTLQNKVIYMRELHAHVTCAVHTFVQSLVARCMFVTACRPHSPLAVVMPICKLTRQ